MGVDINLHIGGRLLRRRRLLGLTQVNVGRALGVSHQAIHHYECGSARISAAMIWVLAGLLEVPVSYFFDGLP